MSLTPLAYIPSPSGLSLTSDERDLYRKYPPWGMILMGRSVRSKEQVSALTNEIREIVGRDCLIFIDQEGGRVARLKTPEWPAFPSGEDYENLYLQEKQSGLEAVRLGYRLLAKELAQIGVNANCAPVADIRFAEACDVIGDRAFGKSAANVAELAREAIFGMALCGVASVVKHIPGHGRATVDSHESLPNIDANITQLSEDFEAFQKLNDAPMAMTGHVAYQALDPNVSATHSKTVINDIIRRKIGFDGVLISDDIGMQALTGSLTDRTKIALQAGCDVVLHCAGFKSNDTEIVSEMYEVGMAANKLAEESSERCIKAEQCVATIDDFDYDLGWSRFYEFFPELGRQT